jgi:hypothetical protein
VNPTDVDGKIGVENASYRSLLILSKRSSFTPVGAAQSVHNQAGTHSGSRRRLPHVAPLSGRCPSPYAGRISIGERGIQTFARDRQRAQIAFAGSTLPPYSGKHTLISTLRHAAC